MKGDWGWRDWVGERFLGISLPLVFSLLGTFNTHATTAAPVRLSWDASADSSVAGYVVYYGEMNTGVTNRLDAGATQTACLKTLQAGVKYFFFVTAYKTGGAESDPSNTVQYTPPALTRLKMGTQPDGTMRVQFRGPAGTLCSVEFTESLTAPQWHTLNSVTTDEEGNIVVDDPLTGQPETRFYRGVLP